MHSQQYKAENVIKDTVAENENTGVIKKGLPFRVHDHDSNILHVVEVKTGQKVKDKQDFDEEKKAILTTQHPAQSDNETSNVMVLKRLPRCLAKDRKLGNYKNQQLSSKSLKL